MEIFIANLDTGIEEELLSKLFEAFGPVTNTVLVRDKETRMSKGYGFVIMQNAIDAQRAIDDLNGRELAGKILSVKPSVPKEQRTLPNKPNNFVSVSFNNNKIVTNAMSNDDEMNEPVQEEEISVKVVNEANYTTSIADDGLVKISFSS